MTAVNDLWYLADVAEQQAEQTYHELAERHGDFVEFTRHRTVSRPRFRTVAERTRENGLPYGAHTVVYRDDGALLLVYHEDVEMWVLPGGEVEGDDSFREAARRELREEAGIDAVYDGLGILGRAVFHCEGTETWGVLPIYEGRATSTELSVEDPDGEITDAAWFEDLPPDARDRDQLREWRQRRLG